MSKTAGIEGKLHAKHTGRAITLGVCEPTFRGGWSVGGCVCARCGRIGIVDERKVCRRCVEAERG